MWLFTTSGFYSVVQKPWDKDSGTLTVRARVAADLDRLRTGILPSLGPTVEDPDADYRFRAQAAQEAVALAVAQAVRDLDYSNFKSAVADVQGRARASIYHDVWEAVLPLQKPGR